VILKVPAGMMGVETDSVVGVRVAVVVAAEGVSFLLHAAITRQTADKVNIDFFIRNRFLFDVKGIVNHQMHGRSLLVMVHLQAGQN